MVVQHIAAGVGDLQDAVAVGRHAAGHEHAIAGGLFQHGHLIGAERHGRFGAERGINPHAVGQINNRATAQFVGDAHRHGVDRLHQRRGQRDIAKAAAVVVLRRPAANRDTATGHYLFGAISLLNCIGIDVWLEGRTGLTTGPCCAVVLAFAIVAATDNRPHRTAIFQHHHGRLVGAVILAILAQMREHRVFSGLLQAGVDGGFDDQRIGRHANGQFFHPVKGIVEEIVGQFGLVALDRAGRVAPGADHLAFGHELGLHDIGQHFVGTGTGCRQVNMRRIFGRGLVETGHHRRFRQIDVAQLLFEIELRRCRRAKRPATHIGAVEIQFQDLFLGEVVFQPQRQEGFLDLTLQRALIGQKQVFCQLLGDRRTTLNNRIGAGVFHHRADQAENIDAEMLKETPVFGRQNRLDEVVRHLVNRFGVIVQNAALADFVAEAVEEGDGVFAIGPPVLVGFLKGWLGQGQHQHRANHPECQPFTSQFDPGLLQAIDPEAAEKDGQRFPGFPTARLEAVHGVIDP